MSNDTTKERLRKLTQGGFTIQVQEAHDSSAGGTYDFVQGFVRNAVLHGRLDPEVVRAVGESWTVEIANQVWEYAKSEGAKGAFEKAIDTVVEEVKEAIEKVEEFFGKDKVIKGVQDALPEITDSPVSLEKNVIGPYAEIVETPEAYDLKPENTIGAVVPVPTAQEIDALAESLKPEDMKAGETVEDYIIRKGVATDATTSHITETAVVTTTETEAKTEK